MASVADMEMGKREGAFFVLIWIKMRKLCKLFIQSYIKMCLFIFVFILSDQIYYCVLMVCH